MNDADNSTGDIHVPKLLFKGEGFKKQISRFLSNFRFHFLDASRMQREGCISSSLSCCNQNIVTNMSLVYQYQLRVQRSLLLVSLLLVVIRICLQCTSTSISICLVLYVQYYILVLASVYVQYYIISEYVSSVLVLASVYVQYYMHSMRTVVLYVHVYRQIYIARIYTCIQCVYTQYTHAYIRIVCVYTHVVCTCIMYQIRFRQSWGRFLQGRRAPFWCFCTTSRISQKSVSIEYLVHVRGVCS